MGLEIELGSNCGAVGQALTPLTFGVRRVVADPFLLVGLWRWLRGLADTGRKFC